MKKNILSIIVYIILLIVGLGIGYLIFNKDENQETTNNSKILQQLTGAYGYCELNEINNTVCYILRISEDNGIYSFIEGIYQTDAGTYGTTVNIEETSKNKYKIEVYDKGLECSDNNCLSERDSATYYYNIDMTDKSNIMIERSKYKYEFITKESNDWDAIDSYCKKLGY